MINGLKKGKNGTEGDRAQKTESRRESCKQRWGH